MEIRKAQSAEEQLEARRVIATAFLEPWDAERAQREAEEAGSTGSEELWVALDAGRVVAAIETLREERAYEGAFVPCGELCMVGTLPEARGGGLVRAMAGAVLRDFRARGDVMATLIPFSEAFYRKFGFEPASEELRQGFAIDQLVGMRCELDVRQLGSADELPVMRELWERWALRHSFAPRGGERDWTFRAPSQYGRRAWRHEDKEHYTYLFYDEGRALRAYLTFVFVPGPEGPFTGTMEVADLAYDGPEALRSVLGFAYGMRAKITDVKLTLPLSDDLALLLPEVGKMDRRIETHVMARPLDVPALLCRLRQPQGEGSYTLRVEDAFLSELTAAYELRFAEGCVTELRESDVETPDLELDAGTFGQLVLGHVDLDQARWRPSVRANGQVELLSRVFVRKSTFAGA